MTRDDEAFLTAILAHPDDDLPRLVYADWLEERGDPRGEFIRLQIGLFRQTIPATDVKASEARADELLNANWDQWAEPSGDIDGSCDFSRGFVGIASMDSGALLHHGVRLFSRHPIRHLVLRNVWEDSDRLYDFSVLRRLRGLTIARDRLRNDDLSRLAESRQLAGLEWLMLDHNVFDYRPVEALATTSSLTNLQWLDLGHNNVGTNGVAPIARSPVLQRLVRLDLPNANVGPVGVEALTRRQHLARLQILDLSHNPLGGRGVRELAAKPMRGLSKLFLKGVEMSPVWRERIAAQYPPGVVEF